MRNLRPTGPNPGSDAEDVVEQTTGLMQVTDAAILSPEQRTAIEWLTAGESPTSAAVAAGVGRTTVYRWMKEDPNFQAAYNAWQADVTATVKAQILAAATVAVQAVVGSMAKGDAKTGLALLKQLGMIAPPKPGPVEPDKVARTQRAARERAQMQLIADEESAAFGRPE